LPAFRFTPLFYHRRRTPPYRGRSTFWTTVPHAYYHTAYIAAVTYGWNYGRTLRGGPSTCVHYAFYVTLYTATPSDAFLAYGNGFGLRTIPLPVTGCGYAFPGSAWFLGLSMTRRSGTGRTHYSASSTPLVLETCGAWARFTITPWKTADIVGRNVALHDAVVSRHATQRFAAPRGRHRGALIIHTRITAAPLCELFTLRGRMTGSSPRRAFSWCVRTFCCLLIPAFPLPTLHRGARGGWKEHCYKVCCFAGSTRTVHRCHPPRRTLRSTAHQHIALPHNNFAWSATSTDATAALV